MSGNDKTLPPPVGAHPEALPHDPPAPHGRVQTATGRAPTGGGMGGKEDEMEGQAQTYYTIPQLAEFCGVPKSALYAAARRGDLKTAMPKGCERLKLVKMEWFEEWIGVGE